MGFKLLLAVSADGFLARGPDDDMKWTTHTDKAVFRLLTLTADWPLLVSRKTAALMPTLPRRRIQLLSTQPQQGATLVEMSWAFRDAWLIGGPTVALEAVRANLVSQAVICHSPVNLGEGIPFKPLEDALLLAGGTDASTFALGDITLSIYHRLQQPVYRV